MFMTVKAIQIGVMGALGRMGQALIAAIAENPQAGFLGGIERPDHPQLGNPFPGGQPLVADPRELNCDVLIDFTSPLALARTLEAGRPAVVGTTGLEPAHQTMIDTAAQTRAVLWSANMSLGVALVAALTRQAAERLGPDWDIEILEMHHKHKVDAPSGTALMLGRAAAEGRGVDLDAVIANDRTGARTAGDIGFATLRGGSVPGVHRVIFAGLDELVELTHVAQSRTIFAQGAVRAAVWLARQPAGRYSIADVLGLGPLGVGAK
jgi:4-hydroxy-tetrahydrodipicolinate reductase